MRVARGVGSNVLGILFGGVGVGSFKLDHSGSLKLILGAGHTGSLWLRAATGHASVFVRPKSLANSACPKSRLSSSGVRRGIIAFHVSAAQGEDLGEDRDDADGEYFSTTSVQRWKTGSGI